VKALLRIAIAAVVWCLILLIYWCAQFPDSITAMDDALTVLRYSDQSNQLARMQRVEIVECPEDFRAAWRQMQAALRHEDGVDYLSAVIDLNKVLKKYGYEQASLLKEPRP
jgi:hypothetical protein